MSKAIIGLYALINQTKKALKDVSKSDSYYKVLHAYKIGTRSYQSLIALRHNYSLPVFYKILVEKDGQFIIANSLVEALLKIYKSQDTIYSVISHYNSIMRPDTTEANKDVFIKRLLNSALKYPNTQINREDEFEVIFDFHIYPVFFDKCYTTERALEILSDSNNIIIQIDKESDKADLTLKDQVVKAFSQSSPIEAAKITAEAKFEELKAKTVPIEETTVVNSSITCQRQQIKESTLDAKIKDVISNMVHEYLDEAIDKLAQAIADEVNGCINEAVESRTSVYKKDIEAKIKNLLS